MNFGALLPGGGGVKSHKGGHLKPLHALLRCRPLHQPQPAGAAQVCPAATTPHVCTSRVNLQADLNCLNLDPQRERAGYLIADPHSSKALLHVAKSDEYKLETACNKDCNSRAIPTAHSRHTQEYHVVLRSEECLKCILDGERLLLHHGSTVHY